jgi:hypothetical protein
VGQAVIVDEAAQMRRGLLISYDVAKFHGLLSCHKVTQNFVNSTPRALKISPPVCCDFIGQSV